jgi:Methyltransferase domain
MFVRNSELITGLLAPDDKVLDIGAWGYPFNRADFVIDSEPYETRGYYNRVFFPRNPLPPQGGIEERFTKNTWIQRDICDRQPLPFGDKELDFVICSHTLEDIRDPLWVCSEMIRIAKRGYIEVPSRLTESCRGEERGIVGLSHHRWLIDIEGADICFLMKLHSIHSHWRYSLPAHFYRALSEEQKVQWLFWDGSFSFRERIIHGETEQRAELERFVNDHAPYAAWTQPLMRAQDFGWWFSRGVSRKLSKIPGWFKSTAVSRTVG